MRLLDKVKVFLNSGQERSAKAKKNILAMFFIKGGNIVIGFLLVPLTINYVDQDTYGIWMAISSIVAWFGFCDIGLGNGLKNKLAEALASGDYPLGKKYVSTTYALMALIFLPLMVGMLLVAPSLHWGSILNVNSIENSGLVVAVSIVAVYFCLNSIFSIINVILLADQRPADEALRVFLQQAASLAVIFALTKLTRGDLTKLCIALCACPLVVVVIFNCTLFTGRYKALAPSWKDVQFSLAPDLLKLGVFFFIIQIAGVVQYQMTNFLIIHYYGAAEVTSYNIAYKLFGAINMLWMILTTPLWAAVTDAITTGDLDWVRKSVKTYLKLFVLFLAGSFALLAIAGPIYHIWVGDGIIIPFSVSFLVMVFNLAMMFGNIFVMVLNGASIVKVQTIACCFSPFVFLGCFYWLKNLGLGVESILISSIIANFNGLILAPVQYYNRIVKERRRG